MKKKNKELIADNKQLELELADAKGLIEKQTTIINTHMGRLKDSSDHIQALSRMINRYEGLIDLAIKK